MSLMASLIVGILFAAGIYMVLQRNLFEILLGVSLMSHGTNVLLIAMSGWRATDLPPILESIEGGHHISTIDPSQYVDPLPHALILTAIVIGFGLISFLMVLSAKTFEASRDLQATELQDPEVKA